MQSIPCACICLAHTPVQRLLLRHSKPLRHSHNRSVLRLPGAPRTSLYVCIAFDSPLQIALALVAAAAALVRFVQWKRLDALDRNAIWRLYGVFTFAAFVGSVCGVITWSLYNAHDVLYFDALSLGASDFVQSSAEKGVSYTLYAAHCVFKSLAFAFVSGAKLLVLDRMTQFAVKHAQHALVRLMGVVQRVVLWTVLVVNAVSVAASLASSAYFSLAAGADASAAAAFSNNQTEVGASLLLDVDRHVRVGTTCVAVAQACFAVCLLVIMAAFAGTGVFVAGRIRNFLAGVGLGQSTSAARSARYLLLQTCMTVAVVFATFLIRTVFEIVEALANFYILNSSCGICETCQAEYYLMDVWIATTPQVQSIVISLAEPLALLVALWGMTSERGVQLLNRSRHTSDNDVSPAVGVLVRLVPRPQPLLDGGAAAAAP